MSRPAGPRTGISPPWTSRRTSTAARTRVMARRRCIYTGALQAICDRAPGLSLAGRARADQQAAVRPEAWPRHAPAALRARMPLRRRRRAARHPGRSTCARGNFVEPYSKTVNHLRITSCGLRECIDIVVRESQFEERARTPALRAGAWLRGRRATCAAPGCRCTGTTCRTARSTSGSTAAAWSRSSCGQIDIGQGSNSHAGHRRRRSAGRAPGADHACRRRHRPDADRPRQLLESGDLHGRQRGHAGRANLRERCCSNAAADELDVPPTSWILRGGVCAVAMAAAPSSRFAELVKLAETRAAALDRDRQLPAAEAGRTVQGLGRRAEPGLQLFRLRRRGRRRPPHRVGHGRGRLDRPRYRSGAESDARRGAGRRQRLHGAGRSADGGADLPRDRGRSPQDSVDARIQEPDHVRDAAYPYLPGRDASIPKDRSVPKRSARARCCRSFRQSQMPCTTPSACASTRRRSHPRRC